MFDLTNPKNLIPFVELIKAFKLSAGVRQEARRLNIIKSNIIKTPKELIQSVLTPDWRRLPASLDVPSNSQLFGHLISSAGIEGILYPSKFTDKPCLAIFPHNFPNTDSFVCLDDALPHKKVPARIDEGNWRVCELNFEDILKNF